MYLRHPRGIEALNVQHENQEHSSTDNVLYDLDCFSPENLIEKCAETEKRVRENIANAQEKQCKEHPRKIAKGAKTFTFKIGDLVMTSNARKRGRKGDPLSKEWLGPYTLILISENGKCTLRNNNGFNLKAKVNISQLKPYSPVQTICNNLNSKVNGENSVTNSREAEYTTGISHATMPVPSPSDATCLQSDNATAAATLSDATCSGLSAVELENEDIVFVKTSPFKGSAFELRNTRLRAKKLKQTTTTVSQQNVTDMSFESVLEERMLCDTDINAAQGILKHQFSVVEGLQDTLLGETLAYSVMPVEMIQILHDGSMHWILISTINCADGHVKIYDSMKSKTPAMRIKMQIAALLCCPLSKIKCEYQQCQQQQGAIDCGAFAIAFAVDLCMGQNIEAVSCDQSAMRQHLYTCLQSRHFTPFPRSHLAKGVLMCKTSVTSFPIYCTCRLPHNGVEKMVKCNTCKDCFHVSCVRINSNIGLDIPWNCSICLDAIHS